MAPGPPPARPGTDPWPSDPARPTSPPGMAQVEIQASMYFFDDSFDLYFEEEETDLGDSVHRTPDPNFRLFYSTSLEGNLGVTPLVFRDVEFDRAGTFDRG